MNTQIQKKYLRAEKTTPKEDDPKVLLVGVVFFVVILLGGSVFKPVADEATQYNQFTYPTDN